MIPAVAGTDYQTPLSGGYTGGIAYWTGGGTIAATGTTLYSGSFFATTTGTLGQSSFQHFTYVAATGTSATSTNLYATNGVITNGTITTLSVTGSSTLGNVTLGNSTSTSATSTTLFAQSASTSNLYLATGSCAGANALQLSSSGQVVCGTLSGLSAASSTLLTDQNTFVGSNQFNRLTFTSATGTNATTTSFSTAVLTVTGTATSTFSAGIQLSGGCFRDASATSTCIGRGQAATYVVAASNSINRQYADYLADGTGDQNEINAAIAAAYSAARGKGGKVYLLEGDYSVNGTTTMATSTWLQGSGAGTIIKLANATNLVLNIIDSTNQDSVTISDLTVDGNKANQSSGSNIGINLSNTGSSTIARVNVFNTYIDAGIYVSASGGATRSGIVIDGVHIAGVGGSGIAYTNITNSVITNSTIETSAGGIIITSNLNAHLQITNNQIFNNNGTGIYAPSGLDRAVISGNAISGNTNSGLSGVFGNSVISNNTLYQNGDYGIYLAPGVSNTVISGNTIVDNGAGTASDGINLASGANGNTITGNRITDTAGIGNAIDITSGATDNLITGNYYSGPGAATTSDTGTNTKYTQWDRLTLDTKQLGSVAYSPLSIFASSSVALASTTQMGTGKLLSLNNSTGEKFTIANNGSVGIGSSSPSALFGLSLRDTLYIGSTTASSTFANGINLQAGCFSIGGTCLSSGGTAAGGTGAIQFSNGSGVFSADATQFEWDNTNKALAIGTTTAYAKLTLQGAYGSQQVLFDVASSTNANGSATTSIFSVLSNGSIRLGGTNTNAPIFINGGGTTTNPSQACAISLLVMKPSRTTPLLMTTLLLATKPSLAHRVYQ